MRSQVLGGASRPAARLTVARAVLVLSALGLAVTFAATGSRCQWVQPAVLEGQADWNLYDAVAQRVRGGQSYYPALGTELRSRGYPTNRVFNWRMPTLTWLLAMFPDLGYARWLVIALIGMTLACWYGVLRKDHGTMRAVAASSVLGIVLLPLTIPSVIFYTEAWVGLLIALSLGAFGAGIRPLSVTTGVAALCMRELALPYVLVMLLVATVQRNRREQIAWMAGLVLFAVLFLAHSTIVRGTWDHPILGTNGWCSGDPAL
jgi:hypothetical protein